MDRSDSKAAEFERRTSRRTSRAISLHADRDVDDAADVDGYSAAMAMLVADGFRAPADATDASASNPATSNRNDSLPPSAAKDTDGVPRSSVSSGPPDGDRLPSATGTFESSSVSSNAVPSRSSPPSSSSHLPLPETQTHDAAALSPSTRPRTSTAARPSSIAKSPIDSLAIASSAYTHDASRSGSSSNNNNDDSTGDDLNTAATAGPSSRVSPVQSEEPYQGPSGPSFPYQLYPQNVRMARTLSGVTTSTAAQSDSSYTGPRGPTFPYTMYPQNTMAGSSTIPVAGIPVGFPGMADNYHRRIGPDGEDVADMIGPDGHTEQLPPYSRYPDEAYTRKIAAATSSPQPDPLVGPTVAPHSVPVPSPMPGSVPASGPDPVAAPPATSTAIQPIPGAGGLGLASRNPEFDGTEDVESPQSRYSLRSFNTDGSGHEINTAARAVSEKRKPPTFIQRIGGRRMWGIVPYWALCLVATAFVLMAVILGSVIGSFVAKHKKLLQQHHLGNPSPVSVTVTVDATPIPTPPNLPPLPTGTFNLPLQKDEGPGACFNDTTQAQAWSCSVSFMYGMTVTISDLPPMPDGPMYDISINCNQSATISNNVFWYGEQPPVVQPATPLQLVNDTLDPNRGPAWFKMLPYNKTVIVHESFLSVVPTATPTAAAKNQRDSIQVSGALSFGAAGPFHRKGVQPAQVGDKPWVCTWPDTILEVFIYPNQNTSLYKISMSSAYTPWSTTPTPTPPPPASPAYGAAVTSPESPTEATPASSAAATSSQAPDLPPFPPPYPRVVKLEERRMANSPQATCVQYELKPEGTGIAPVRIKDANGKDVEIVISETETGPSLFAQSKRDILGGDEMFEKRDVSGLSKCGCLWMVT